MFQTFDIFVLIIHWHLVYTFLLLLMSDIFGFEIYWYLIFIFWLLPTSDITEFKIHWYRVWDFWFLQTSDTSISGFRIYWYLVYAYKIYFHLLYTCYLLQTSDISGFVAMSPDGGRIEWDSRQLSRTTGTRRRLVVS